MTPKLIELVEISHAPTNFFYFVNQSYKCLISGWYFVDSKNPMDSMVISVPDTSSDDETVSEEDGTTMSSPMDDDKKTHKCDEEDVLIPVTPEPSIG